MLRGSPLKNIIYICIYVYIRQLSQRLRQKRGAHTHKQKKKKRMHLPICLTAANREEYA